MAATSTEIARRLEKAADYKACIELVNECDRRREEIHARMSAIHQPLEGSARPIPQARLDALRSGIDATRKLDQEMKDLEAESRHLAMLPALCYQKADQFKKQQIFAAAPAASKAVPRSITRVRELIQTLDDELARLNRNVEDITEFLSYPEARFPFDDEQLVELFKLRAELWRTRTVQTVLPAGCTAPTPGDFPKSAALAFWWKDSLTWTFERGPRWPPDRPEVKPYKPKVKISPNAIEYPFG